jgi:hypothetical protein
VIGAINVVGAVIFPAFNDFLAGAFHVPDAVAQELAKSGNPVTAAMAGVQTAVGVVTAAGTVIANTIVTEVNKVRAAAMQPGAFAPLAATKPVTTSAVTKSAITTPAVDAAQTPPKKPRKAGPTTPPQPPVSFANPLSGLAKGLTKVLPPKSKPGAKSGLQSTDLGAQTGVPSRPALRANR